MIEGKTIVISGATSGIGQVAAERLAALGARIVLIARDRRRGEAALRSLRTIAPSVAHAAHYADLSQLAEMKRVGAEIAAAEPRIDVLINNAGAIFSRRHETADGLERTFALNHLSYFVLTAALRERLIASASARVVNVASAAHRRGHLDFADLQSVGRYQPYAAYGTTKLCNILFTRELARRLAGTSVTANSLHPGFVATRFGDEAGGLFGLGVRVAKLWAITPAEGARTIVYLASSPNVSAATGGFYEGSRLSTPTAEAQDDAVARRLWAESERLTGIRM